MDSRIIGRVDEMSLTPDPSTSTYSLQCPPPLPFNFDLENFDQWPNTTVLFDPSTLPLFHTANNKFLNKEATEYPIFSLSNLPTINDPDPINDFSNFPTTNSILQTNSDQLPHSARDILHVQDPPNHNEFRLPPQHPRGVDILDTDCGDRLYRAPASLVDFTEGRTSVKLLSKVIAPTRSDNNAYSGQQLAKCATLPLTPSIDTSCAGDLRGFGVNEMPTQLVSFAEVAVRLLLGRNDTDPSTLGRKLLLRASEDGDEVVVQMLLSRDDVEPNSRSMFGLTPLVMAAENGHEAVVQLLLGRHDINPDPKDDRGRTPLWCAARNGHEGVVRLLLERKDVDLNANDDQVDGRTPLMIAAWYGHEEVVRLLLGRDDVDPNIPDKSGETPLWCAAWFGHAAVVQLLLKRDGINADPRNERGDTLLWWSAFNGHGAIVQLLLQRENINPNQQSEGLTPLMVAAWSGHEAVVRLLLGHEDVKADIHAPCGWTALTFAANNGHEAVVRILLEQDSVDADEALSFAVYNGLETILQLLWKQDGISDESRDKADGRVRAPKHTPYLARFPTSSYPTTQLTDSSEKET
jgi:ankyrin repeat protein